MGSVKTYEKSTPPEPLNLTDDEIEVIARILHELGTIPDWRRRVSVAAVAIKIGIMSEDDPMHEAIRKAAGITPKGGDE